MHPAPADAGSVADAGAGQLMDPSADPCRDFYAYACGGWDKTAQVPPNQLWFDRVDAQVSTRRSELLNEILRKGLPRGDLGVQRAHQVFEQCMDEAALEATKPTELGLVAEIAQLADARDLPRLLGKMHRKGVRAAFWLRASVEQSAPHHWVAELGSPGPALPWAAAGPQRLPTSDQLGNAFAALGVPGLSAERALAMERELTEAWKSDATRSDQPALSSRELAALATGFDFAAYFSALGIPAPASVEVQRRAALARAIAVLQKQSPETLRGYLSWRSIAASSPALPRRMRQSVATTAATPREETCRDIVSSLLQGDVGAAFAARALPPAARERARAVAEAMRGGFAELLENASWLDAPTRDLALKKLGRMRLSIGAPDQFEAAGFERGASFLATLEAGMAARRSLELARLSRIVDPDYWPLGTTVPNMFHEPLLNRLIAPAAFLLPPRFVASAPDATSYAVLGVALAHEIAHAFDSQGSRVDPEGAVREWWTVPSRRAFAERVACMEAEIERLHAGSSARPDARRSVAESIADIAGTRAAVAAFKRQLASTPGVSSFESSAALAALRAFFIADAQAHCRVYSDEGRSWLSHNDEHLLEPQRVNFRLAHVPEFAQAFKCAAGTELAPAKSCELF